MSDRKPQQGELLRFIRQAILKNKPVRITTSTSLFQESLLDSMNILELIGFIEEKLGRSLKDEEIVTSNFQSVKAIHSAFFHE